MIKTVLFIISLSIAFSQTPDERGYIVKVGDDLPEFLMDFPDGSQINSKDLLGNVTCYNLLQAGAQYAEKKCLILKKKFGKYIKMLV